MKNKYFLLLFFFCFTIFCFGQGVALRATTSNNFVANGDMSTWNYVAGSQTVYETLPASFFLRSTETNAASYFSKSDQLFNGKNAIQMSYKHNSSGSARSFSTSEMYLTPGVYESVFYLKGTGYIRVVDLSATDVEQPVTVVSSEKVLTGFPLGTKSGAQTIEDWTQYTLYFNVSVESYYKLHFSHNNYNSDNSDPFLIANISLKSVDGSIPEYVQRKPLPNLSLGPIPIPQTDTKWQSDMVKINDEGKLSYLPDSDGFVIPNFSHAGYMSGNAEIPNVPVVKEISPVAGDNTVHIQQAIDQMGSLPLDSKGIRGALLLKKGLYPVKGPIRMSYDGVVIRGEGNDADPETSTIIYDWYRDDDGYESQRSVLIIGAEVGSWSYEKTDETNILDDVVPIGSYTVRIARNENYKKGDVICVFHPCTEAWLKAVNYGEVGGASFAAEFAWNTSTAPISYQRYVADIKHTATETQITLDAPVFYTLRKELSQSVVYKFTNRVIQQSGLENIRIAINSIDGSTSDESHAWNAVSIRNSENCWVRNAVATGFGKSGFSLQRTTRTTIEDCIAMYPVARRIGERMYNFGLSSQSQLILFKNCYGHHGRHAFVSNGTSTVSGIVFYKCKAEGSTTRSEAHRMWTQGLLYDNYEDYNPITKATILPVLGLFNRWEAGSGHGWASANSVLWSCNVRSDYTTPEALTNAPNKARSQITLEKPPTSQNYAIGCFLERSSDIIVYKKSLGYIEGTNTPGLQPASLYKAQLDWRKKSEVNSGIGTSKKNETVVIYPNPAKDSINVGIDGNGQDMTVAIFSFDGRKLIEQKDAGQEQIAIGSLSPGVYLVQVTSEGKTQTERLIKQ